LLLKFKISFVCQAYNPSVCAPAKAGTDVHKRAAAIKAAAVLHAVVDALHAC